MTKKDYILLSNCIKASFDVPFSDGEIGFIKNLSYNLKLDNPRFREDKFMKACGILPSKALSGYEADTNNPADETHY